MPGTESCHEIPTSDTTHVSLSRKLIYKIGNVKPTYERKAKKGGGGLCGVSQNKNYLDSTRLRVSSKTNIIHTRTIMYMSLTRAFI